MAKVDVYNFEKSKVGSVDLPSEVFDQPWRADIVQQVVRWQLACRRRGTHNTKKRADVSGGGKKPYKQKGTGNARRGSQRSPLIRGGAVVFGPAPRDYGYTLPKKIKKFGLRITLSRLLRDGNLFVVSDMKSSGKTKELVKQLGKFGIAKAVIIDKDRDTKFDRASRNLPNFRYYSTAGMNVYDLMKYGAAIISKDSLEQVVKRCTVGGAE